MADDTRDKNGNLPENGAHEDPMDGWGEPFADKTPAEGIALGDDPISGAQPADSRLPDSRLAQLVAAPGTEEWGLDSIDVNSSDPGPALAPVDYPASNETNTPLASTPVPPAIDTSEGLYDSSTFGPDMAVATDPGVGTHADDQTGGTDVHHAVGTGLQDQKTPVPLPTATPDTEFKEETTSVSVATAADDLDSTAAAADEAAAPPSDQDDVPSAEESVRREVEELPLSAPLPTAERSWLTDYKLFKLETQKLARIGGWRKIAALTAHALNNAPFSTRMTRTAMLLDLAQLYRDRLKDAKRAEDTFAVLAEEDPSSTEALDFLSTVYAQREDWQQVYALYVAAVEATWDPNDRLQWTEKAADVAEKQLGRPELAISAWEHLWQLGDAVAQAARALGRHYRKAGRWAEMASFLRQQAFRLEGPTQLVVLRELAEVLLSALQSPDEASDVLEQIVAHSPQDGIATLQLARVYAQRKDWTALEGLGKEASEGDQSTATDLQHLVADALWEADRLDQAIEAYERILDADPNNHDGLKRKREYFERTIRYEELLTLLEERADSVSDSKERAALLAEAAAIAEDQLDRPEVAVVLWESHSALLPDAVEAFSAMERLNERLGNDEGVAQALSGQLKLARDVEQKVELLRRLGDLYSRKLEDDDQAESCWKQILSLDPSDLPTREELTELHRRRQDFEALNSSLLRQIWLTDDQARAEKLCRMAAENLDENFKDAARSVEGWRRVLDFAPRDLQALQRLAEHYETLDNSRELIATLEMQIRAVDDLATRIEIAMRVGQLWEHEGQDRAAAATYERVLRWEPAHEQALGALVPIYAKHGQRGRAGGLLDRASASVDRLTRVQLGRLALALLDDDDHEGRFFALRRILFLADGDPAVLEELSEAAEKAGAWQELASVLLVLASQQEALDDRHELLEDLAHIHAEKLDQPDIAYLLHQGTMLSPEHHASVAADMEALAEKTGRWEDLLVVLDRLATAEFEQAQRKEFITRRATICEQKLNEPLRAFYEHYRCLELDSSDWTALEKMKALAVDKKLWPQLDAALAELYDRTEDDQKRLQLLAERQEVAQAQGEDLRAFDFLVGRYRIAPDDLEVLEALTQRAEQLGAWDWLLPLLEAAQLAPVDQPSPDELMVTSALYEEKLEDLDRAFTLYREVFVIDPTSSSVLEKLEALADGAEAHEQLADAQRMAAATSDNPEQTLKLLRKIAAIYEDKLDAPSRAIDVHRRLLDLKSDEISSLEVMIEWHRGREEWRDLRDRLRQWIALSNDKAGKVLKLAEVAEISQQRLSDAEEALQAYGDILEIDSEHGAAKQGLEGLVSALTEPGLRRRWLQMQIVGASKERAVELQLEIARILEDDLEDSAGAIEELKQLVETHGATSGGFEPLARLLESKERFGELAELLENRAQALLLPDEKTAALEQAVSVVQRHVEENPEAMLERFYEQLLELRPDDREARVQLGRLLRNGSRWKELAKLVEKGTKTATAQQRLAGRRELARLYMLHLDRPSDAKGVYQAMLAEDPEDEGAILALATMAWQEESFDDYLDLRKRQAKLLDPQEGAVVLCHLAEVCDEVPTLKPKMVTFYREARALDPDNVPAMEALKGIGRRLKTLRPAAALWPEPGERDLSVAERATAMLARAEEIATSEPLAAVDFARRATAITPNNTECWAVLARLLEAAGDPQAAFRARREGVLARMRSVPVDPAELRNEAEQLHQLADAAQRAGRDDLHAAYVQQAFELVPNYAPAALATARTHLQSGALEAAEALLQEVIEQYEKDLTEEQLAAAYFSRGAARRQAGQREAALEDFRASLKRMPLHSPCLTAMGDLLAELGLFGAALEHHIRALAVTDADEARARQYHRIGALWEDGLSAFDEAGACYEMALAEDTAERDLLHRALQHYKRCGRLDESLDVVDGLLPTSEDPEELATLWLMRGEILAAREGAEDEAIEAFDMALSYDPARQRARDGLVSVLEQRGDWQQLLQVLEATADGGTPRQRSAALMRMATIAADQLGDPDQAEDYLRKSVEAFPTREALDQLEQMCGDDPNRAGERREVLGLLVGFGPPWFERCVELGRLLLEEDRARAWCLLSPLLGVSQVDADVKALVQSMRKEFERPPLRCTVGTEAFPSVYHPDSDRALAAVFAELEIDLANIGLRRLEDLGEATIAVGMNTSLGRTFSLLADAMGLEGATLHRTQNLPSAVLVVNDPESPKIVVRTEVMQQLVHAEVGFLFGYALELAQPGHRLMGSLPPELRVDVLPALWHALGFSSMATGDALVLSNLLKQHTDDDKRKRWAKELSHLAEEEPRAYGLTWWQATNATARRVGLIAGADLRQIFRVVARMDEGVPRPRVVSRLEELDEYIQQADVLQDLVAFAAAPAFGKLLASANELGEE